MEDMLVQERLAHTMSLGLSINGTISRPLSCEFLRRVPSTKRNSCMFLVYDCCTLLICYDLLYLNSCTWSPVCKDVKANASES